MFRPTPITLSTSDGVRLRGQYLSGPGSTGVAFAVGHGFTNHVRKPAVRAVLRRLAEHGAVLAVDFRGHGRSGGASSVGPPRSRTCRRRWNGSASSGTGGW
ncbi:hypothetical protein [Saccharopolyspora gregorii]|uniref:hypothetical protein n=1 Tax=Saccharopolyspora gregorii TaxID=33914 RepID=UPI0031EF01C5